MVFKPCTRSQKGRKCTVVRRLYSLNQSEEKGCISTTPGRGMYRFRLGYVWYSKLDATWGYWKVKIKDSDTCKTAFITKHGLFHFKRMGFVLYNAPTTFSRVMDLVLTGLHCSVVLAFLDDFLVLDRDLESHICNLAKVFQRFRDYGV